MSICSKIQATLGKGIFFLLTFQFSIFNFQLSHAQYEKLGGVYYAYPIESGDATPLVNPAPEGYEPFYISHYGRHGSRWLPDDERYIWVNKQFEDTRNLTKLGKSVRKRLAKIWKNAEGNGGKLTPLGARQHRGIARRMYQNFPSLFTPDAHLTARSSTVGRCISSMENFLSELSELSTLHCPLSTLHSPLSTVHSSLFTLHSPLSTLHSSSAAANSSLFTLHSSLPSDMSWLAYKSPELSAFEKSHSWSLPISTDRFINALFTDAS